MQHRTQLYLDEAQYQWLKRQARDKGSVAGVVRELIERARTQPTAAPRDPLIDYLLERPDERAGASSTVETLDSDLYG